MKEFDYTIIGGGCSGLSLAYELEINNQLQKKSLAIIEPRDKYQKDKTWSFWRVFDHNFDSEVRSKVLIECLKNYLNSDSWEYELENNNGGDTFYIIHPVLKHLAILKDSS